MRLHLQYLYFEKVIEVRSLDTKDAKLLDELKEDNERLKSELQAKESSDQDLRKDFEALKQQMAMFTAMISSGQVMTAKAVLEHDSAPRVPPTKKQIEEALKPNKDREGSGTRFKFFFRPSFFFLKNNLPPKGYRF